MKTVDLNKIGFGSWQFGGENIIDGQNRGWSGVDEDLALETLSEAYESGIRFYDTADSYGNGRSEELLGIAFNGRKDAIICSKFGARITSGKLEMDFSADYAELALESSLKRLGRVHVDYYLVHSPAPTDISNSLIERLHKLKEQGLIGKIGLSVSFLENYMDYADCFDSFEVLFNPISRQNEAYINRLKDREVFVRSLFSSGLLLKALVDYDRERMFDDWRSGLPESIVEMAKVFVASEPDFFKRYCSILVEALSLPVEKVIIGFSSRSQLNYLFNNPAFECVR